MFRQKLRSSWEQVTFAAVIVMAMAVVGYEPLITAAAGLVIAVGVSTIVLFGEHRFWLRLMVGQVLMFVLISATGGWLFRGVVSSSLIAMASYPGSFLDDLFHGRWSKVFG